LPGSTIISRPAIPDRLAANAVHLKITLPLALMKLCWPSEFPMASQHRYRLTDQSDKLDHLMLEMLLNGTHRIQQAALSLHRN
jgi:hypothetical protein